uniref:DUF6034 family protein n=1 Tax=Coprococcus sp. TaxID=2049024 RepID=UPI0040250B33
MVKIKKKTEPVEYVHTIRSPYYKKLTALVLMGALAAGTVFTGCGKKDIDYVDGGSGGGDSGSLQSKYGIPESCDTTLNSGSSGISKLAIEADEIQVPDTADLPIVYVKKKDMTDDKKKQITESIFEKEKGIYAYDSEHLIKTDLQAEIDMYEQQKKNSAANGDTSSASWYDSMIDELKDQMQTAPDEYPAATDFSGDNYLGERNDRQYLLNIGMSDGAASGYLGLKDSLITYRPKDGADGVYYSAPDTGEDLSGVDAAQTNACIFSQEEAQSIAEEFIASLGITDVTLKDSQDLYWYYYGTDGSTTSVDIDGYVFSYTKAINNQSTESPKLWNVDNLTQDKADVEVPSESCEINVDSNGVLSASWVDFLEFTDKTESKELLSFDELLKKADKNIAEYYK